MPAQPITEFFNGGLVTARHPALLLPGEVQLATDCVYREKDPSIQRAPGRTVYNSTTLKTTPTGSTVASIKGLSQLTFDQNTDQVIAWPSGDGTSSYLWKSDFTGITGSFSIITGPGQVVASTHSNTTIDGAPVGSFTNMLVGARVTGSGIPAGTYVDSVTSGVALVLTSAATASATVTLTFDAGIAYPLQDISTDILDVIQWQNTYFLLPNGPVQRLFWKKFSGSSAVESLIVRSAGMLPVTTFVDGTGVTVQSGAGWSSVLGNGYYWFLITEILSSDDPQIPDVESGYTANEGRALVVNITTNATQFIRITFPSLRNDGSNGTNRATHWGVYMSFIGPGAAAYSDNTNMPSAATFRRVLKVSVEETSKDIKFDNVNQNPRLPTTSAAIGSLAQFSNPSRVFLEDLLTANGTSGNNNTAANAFAGFGMSSGSPYSGYTITGIIVEISTKAIGDHKAGYYIWLDNNSTKASNRVDGVASGTGLSVQRWGGQSDTWGQTWTPGDIANLRVLVQKSYTSAVQTIGIDYLKVTVFYSGGALGTGTLLLDGPPYQVVTYRSQIGTTVNDPANYLIPSSSTGDIFQGSLVVNDILVPNIIRYSLANAPESFPKPYFETFNSKKKDIVTLIRRLGQILIVGMRDSIKRVNYLPTEADVDFQQGLAYEDIVTDHGIAGAHAAALMDITGIGVVLSYVSYNGFYFTDGITSRPLNLDIKLSDLVKTGALSTSVLRVYPREKWLVFYYCPNGASHTKNTRAIIFHYSQDKIKEGGFLPATGPLSISARASAPAILNGVPYLLTGHQSDGKIYVEDSGDSQASGYQVHNSSDSLVDAPIIPVIRTRKIYPSGYSRDARSQRIYLLHDQLGSSITAASVTTANSTTVSSSAAFGSVVVGMRVHGDCIDGGTIVIAKATSSSITLSRAANTTGTPTLTFDDGTLALTMRGSSINEAVYAFDTQYISTVLGDLCQTQHDNMTQGFELQIEKVILPSGTEIDLSQKMRLHNFTYLADDIGTEQNRGT
jgi:hypothetical protein